MAYDFASGLMWYEVFLCSTICHEAAHAWTALKLGDDTAARGGQASLNPLPHIRREPFGMIVVPILSWLAGGWLIGWASAPYDPVWARTHPRRAAWMAMAGPASNLALAVLAGLCIRLGYEWHIFTSPITIGSDHLAVATLPGAADTVAKFLSIFVSLNLLLCAFNLIPLPPLDGSSAPLLLLPDRMVDGYMQFMRHPFLSYAGIFLASRLVGPILPKLLLGAASLLYPTVHYH